MEIKIKCPVLLCIHNANGVCGNVLDDCPFEDEREGIDTRGESING